MSRLVRGIQDFDAHISMNKNDSVNGSVSFSLGVRYSLNPAHIRFTITLGGSRGYTDSSGRQGPQFWRKH